MYVVYGNFRSVSAECEITPIRRMSLLNAAQVQYGFRETWVIRGFLQDAGPPQLTADINAMLNYFVSGGSQLALYNDDGTPTAHALSAAVTTGGIRVTDVTFPTGTGAEYTTFRSWSVTVQFDYRYPVPALIDFFESCRYWGGGPLIAALEPINGPAQIQLVKQQTAYRVVQSGRAVGQFAYPVPPPPIWPGNLEMAPEIEEDTPRRIGNNYVDWPVRWTYRFVSAFALVGNPNLWPLGQ